MCKNISRQGVRGEGEFGISFKVTRKHLSRLKHPLIGAGSLVARGVENQSELPCWPSVGRL